MVYVYYNLQFLVRRIQKTPDLDAILLDGIDTNVEWRVEFERLILESMSDWIHEEVEGEVTEEEEEAEEGDATEQSQIPSSWTPTEGSVLVSSTSRGHHILALASSTRCQSLVLAPGTSSSRRKYITFSYKRGRGNH
jgi:hypothetical protein